MDEKGTGSRSIGASHPTSKIQPVIVADRLAAAKTAKLRQTRQPQRAATDPAVDLGTKTLSKLDQIARDDEPSGSRPVGTTSTASTKSKKFGKQASGVGSVPKDPRDMAVIRAVYAQVRANRSDSGKTRTSRSSIVDEVGFPQYQSPGQRLKKVLQQVGTASQQVRTKKRVMDIFPNLLQENRARQMVQDLVIPAFREERWEDCLTALLQAKVVADGFEQGAGLKSQIQDAIRSCKDIVTRIEDAKKLKNELLVMTTMSIGHIDENELQAVIAKAMESVRALGGLCKNLQTYVMPLAQRETESPDSVHNLEEHREESATLIVPESKLEAITPTPDWWEVIATAQKFLVRLRANRRMSLHADERRGAVKDPSLWTRASLFARVVGVAGWRDRSSTLVEKEEQVEPSPASPPQPPSPPSSPLSPPPSVPSPAPAAAPPPLMSHPASAPAPAPAPPPPPPPPSPSLLASPKPPKPRLMFTKRSSFFDDAFYIDPAEGDCNSPIAENEPPPLLYVKKVHSRKQLQRQLTQFFDGNNEDELQAVVDEDYVPVVQGKVGLRREDDYVPVVQGKVGLQWEDDDWRLRKHYYVGEASLVDSTVLEESEDSGQPRTGGSRPQSSSLTKRSPVAQRPNRHVESVCVERQNEPEQPANIRVHDIAENERRDLDEASAARINRVPIADDFLVFEDEIHDTVADPRWAGPSQIKIRMPLGRRPATGDYWSAHRMTSLQAKFSRDATPREGAPATLSAADPKDRPRPRPRPSSAPGHSHSRQQRRPGSASTKVRNVEGWCDLIQQRDAALKVP